MSDLSAVVVGMVTHHGPKRQTSEMVQGLCSAGALFRAEQHPDVYLARNLLLSGILADPQCGGRTTVLLVDDDNFAPQDAVKRLIDWSRTDISRHPLRCAPYPTVHGQLAASPLRDNPRPKLWFGAEPPSKVWESGLGLAAVRRDALDDVARKLDTFAVGDRTVHQWCHGGIVNGLWCADDASLCMHFGGAVLDHTVAAAHIKEVPIQPDPESLRRLRDNESLVNDAPARTVER